MSKQINIATNKGTRLTTPKRMFELSFENTLYSFAIVEYPTVYMNDTDEMLITRAVHVPTGRVLPILAPNKGVSVKKYIDVVKEEIAKIFEHYGADKFKDELDKYEIINS
jgi:hypothetical protein